jgi:FkbM family methyltransferase
MSVTHFFYHRGWHGVNVEPLPQGCEALQKWRPRDVNVHAGCGAAPGNMTIVYGDCGGLCAHIMPAPQRGGWPVAIVTLDSVFDNYVPPGQDVHFCKIDVEGFEKDVITAFNMTRHRPWTFCIEWNDVAAWEPVILRNGYKFAMEHYINRYYYDAVNRPQLGAPWRSADEIKKDWHFIRH